MLLAINWAEFGIKAAQLLLSLSILIIFHEFGHFITARWFKCRVEKFYLFFDPWFSIFKKKVGDTEYGIGWLPLGGYVKISGMIDESMDKEAMKLPAQDWEFRSKPAWQRLIIMIGGVTVNVLLAFIIYAMILFVWGEEKVPMKDVKYGIWAQDQLMTDIGLRNGDKILSVNDKPVPYFGDLNAKVLTGEKILVERDGQQKEILIPINLVEKLIESKRRRGLLSYRIPAIVTLKNGTLLAFAEGRVNNAGDFGDINIVLKRSTDQGKTWTKPLRISKFAGDCIDDDNTVEGAVPTVGPNGEIYVTWSGPKGLVFQRSIDGGQTWMPEEQFITTHEGGWTIDIPGMYRANGLPILVCDLSNGPNRGTLYLNWCDQRNGVEDTDVWLLVSRDGGATWNEEKRVNQDASNRQQFFTWMTIDQSTGFLYFIYYDRRNYDSKKTDVYLAVSRDGGKTFHEHRISETPFVPNDKVFFGDYLNIAAVNGVIAPIWPRMDNGKITLLTTTIKEADLLKLSGE